MEMAPACHPSAVSPHQTASAQVPVCGGDLLGASSERVVFEFQRIYADHAGFVFRVLRGMGVADSGVEDALQDVFVVVHRRLPEFDGRYSMRTWLFEIALRVASDHRRKQRRRVS